MHQKLYFTLPFRSFQPSSLISKETSEFSRCHMEKTNHAFEILLVSNFVTPAPNNHWNLYFLKCVPWLGSSSDPLSPGPEPSSASSGERAPDHQLPFWNCLHCCCSFCAFKTVSFQIYPAFSNCLQQNCLNTNQYIMFRSRNLHTTPNRVCCFHSGHSVGYLPHRSQTILLNHKSNYITPSAFVINNLNSFSCFPGKTVLDLIPLWPHLLALS